MLYILNVHGDRQEFDVPNKYCDEDNTEQAKQHEQLRKSRSTDFWRKYEELEAQGIKFKWLINSSIAREYFCDEIDFKKSMKKLHSQGINGFFPMVKIEERHYVSLNALRRLNRDNV